MEVFRLTEKTTQAAIEQLRREFKENDDRRDAGLPTTLPGVRRIDDQSYGPDPQWHRLDLYLPKNARRPLPTIINIHGGGWCYGTKETYQFYGLNWAQRGFAFVNANYRLAPAVTFPEQLNDVQAYVQWVADHAAKYHLDVNNVFLVGDSAGGQMAEQYATLLCNPVYRAQFNYNLAPLHFRALVLNSAAVFLLDPGMLSGAVAAYFPPEIVRTHRAQLDTEAYIEAPFLPTFICTGTADFLRNNAAKFDGFLTAKGVEHQFRMYGTTEKPEGHVFNVDQKNPVGRRATDDQQAFLTAHLAKN